MTPDIRHEPEPEHSTDAGAPAAPVVRREPARLAPRALVGAALLCAAALACAPPAAAPRAPQLGSVVDALSHHRERYEVGWLTASGTVTYSDVTAVAVEADGRVRLELAEPSLIWGTAGPRTLSGHWKDADATGELWIEFAADYASGTGWWNHGGTTEKRNLWLRLSAEQ